jgi:hypothetical protein
MRKRRRNKKTRTSTRIILDRNVCSSIEGLERNLSNNQYVLIHATLEIVTKVETGSSRTSCKYLILIRSFSCPIDRSFLIDPVCIGVKSNRAEASWICEMMGRPVSREKSRVNAIPAIINGPVLKG